MRREDVSPDIAAAARAAFDESCYGRGEYHDKPGTQLENFQAAIAATVETMLSALPVIERTALVYGLAVKYDDRLLDPSKVVLVYPSPAGAPDHLEAIARAMFEHARRTGVMLPPWELAPEGDRSGLIDDLRSALDVLGLTVVTNHTYEEERSEHPES